MLPLNDQEEEDEKQKLIHLLTDQEEGVVYLNNMIDLNPDTAKVLKEGGMLTVSLAALTLIYLNNKAHIKSNEASHARMEKVIERNTDSHDENTKSNEKLMEAFYSLKEAVLFFKRDN
jgi:hypothetical protein